MVWRAWGKAGEGGREEPRKGREGKGREKRGACCPKWGRRVRRGLLHVKEEKEAIFQQGLALTNTSDEDKCWRFLVTLNVLLPELA